MLKRTGRTPKLVGVKTKSDRGVITQKLASFNNGNVKTPSTKIVTKRLLYLLSSRSYAKHIALYRGFWWFTVCRITQCGSCWKQVANSTLAIGAAIKSIFIDCIFVCESNSLLWAFQTNQSHQNMKCLQ